MRSTPSCDRCLRVARGRSACNRIGGRMSFANDAQGRSGSSLWCSRLAAGAADARAIKWARSGDALTLDPHAQNEGPTHNLLHLIYEPLILRDRTGKLLPTLATVLADQRGRPDGVGVQAAPGREVPQRQRLQRRRRRVLARPRAAADLRHEGPAHLHRQGQQGRRLHGAHQDQGAQSAAPELPDQPLHDGQGVGRGQQHRRPCRTTRRRRTTSPSATPTARAPTRSSRASRTSRRC